jgi:hypothetical protein
VAIEPVHHCPQAGERGPLQRRREGLDKVRRVAREERRVCA